MMQHLEQYEQRSKITNQLNKITMKNINNKCIFKNETLSLTECRDGFWLYDYILGQNISMRAKDEQNAFIEALSFYQKRYKKIEKEYKELNNKVYSMLALFIEDKED